nr:hypothetical protein [Tanacetum cinerariifolium]
MDLFSLIRAPNPTKVKIESRPRAPHELPLLTLTASRVIEMDEPAVATDSSGVPSAIEKSPLDFADEAGASGQETAAPEVPLPEEVPVATVPGGDQAALVVVEPLPVQESRKRGREGSDANAPPKSLRRDHADLQPSGSSRGGKSLAAMQLCLASNIFVYEGVPADVSDPDPLAFADAPSPPSADVIRSSQGVAAARDPRSENVSSPTVVGSPGSDSLKNWNNRFFWVDECVFPPAVEWRTSASKDGMPASGTYSVEAVRVLDTHQMDLFSLISAPNPTKVKIGSRPRAPHELPLLTLTASRVIEMDEPAVATDSSGVPSAIEKSPLDFADEAGASSQETAAPESRKRGREGSDANAPPKSLRRDHADLQPSGSSRGGKSLAAMQLCLASNIFVYEGVPADVSDPDPLAFADAPSPPSANVIRSSQGVAAARDPGSKNVSSPTVVGSPGSVDTLQQQVSREETLKAAFEDYKRQQDQMVEQRCAEMDARLDAMSAYDPEAEAKFAAALQSLKDLKLSLLDQLEGLKDAPMDVIMASLYLEDDT